MIEQLRDEGDCDLIFANLVDFDMRYGHRNDPDGYAGALAEFDSWLGTILQELDDEEYLLIAADHGCDPTTRSTDHSREYVPLIVHRPGCLPLNVGTVRGFGLVGATVAGLLGVRTDVQRRYEQFAHLWTGE
jgi:phosphopentomutase